MISKEHILQSQLQEYCQSGMYPMHMPGHKRSLTPVPGLAYDWDVTEVPGTDDLHAADGILKEAMDRTSMLFGSRRTWYLVNGSTCGLLAAVYACVPAGGEAVIARNCHKSVYHAAELLNLKVHWVVPPLLSEWEVFGSVPPAEVERALREHPSAKTVVITSPTYEGVISDIASIARICHAHGARLIVDEAHGAHLGLLRAEGIDTKDPSCPEKTAGNRKTGEPAETDENTRRTQSYFPESALHLGADIVVQSAHKTLPSLTQTALLHLGRGGLSAAGEGADAAAQDGIHDGPALERRIEHALDIFETSSPSYLLMASLDGCTGLLSDRGEELFTQWRGQIRRTDEVLAGLRHLKALRPGGRRTVLPALSAGASGEGPQGCGQEESGGIFAYDDSRFLLRADPECGVCGNDLSEFLRAECGIEPEMHCGGNVLLMSGCGDSPEGWETVRKALCRLDHFLSENAGAPASGGGEGAARKARRACAARLPSGQQVAVLAESPCGAENPREDNMPLRGPECRELSQEDEMTPFLQERMEFSGGFAETALTPAEAHRRVLAGEVDEVPLAEAAGRISAEYVMAYPPGVPVLVPGERISPQSIRTIRQLTGSGSDMRYSLSERLDDKADALSS